MTGNHNSPPPSTKDSEDALLYGRMAAGMSAMNDKRGKVEFKSIEFLQASEEKIEALKVCGVFVTFRDQDHAEDCLRACPHSKMDTVKIAFSCTRLILPSLIGIAKPPTQGHVPGLY